MSQDHRLAKPRKTRLLGNHQKCWIWGRHVVRETLRAGMWRPLEVHISDALPQAECDEITRLCESSQIPIHVEPAARLRELCKSEEHQGCLAKMPEFPYADADRLLREFKDDPLLVLLDGIQDPHNLGAIIRSAEVFGLDAVVLPATGQVGVTSLVARTSAGAVNHIPLCRVPDLMQFVAPLKQAGWQIVATQQTAEQPITQIVWRQPTAVVIGSEAIGVSPNMLQLCDLSVAIPQHGSVGSLNAAVAAGIVFYEATQQRKVRQTFQPDASGP